MMIIIIIIFFFIKVIGLIFYGNVCEGLEARVPFLDADFLDVAMSIDPAEKMITPGRIEKHILRDAFDEPDDPYLPKDILWRQKEQFSDGVGYGNSSSI